MVIRRVTTVVAVIGCVGLFAAPSAGAEGPPLVEASWVTEVGGTGATLRAEIDPNGLTTEYRFEYISQSAYEANLAAAREGFFGASETEETGIGKAPTEAHRRASGLSPLTSYRYRPVAGNSADTTVGPEHAFTTTPTTSVFQLPDARGWEMVSPVEKGGGAVGAPETLFGGGDFQAAEGGDAVTWGSATAFGEAAGAPPVSQYLSHWTGSGWTTENVSAPLESGGYGDEPDGAPYRVFSADLSRGLMLDGTRCAVEGTCPPEYSLWVGGPFQVLPTTAGLSFAGASPDLRHVVFEADSGLYEWNGGSSLTQLSSEPGAALAAPIGAVLSNGSVYFTEPEDGPLYFHEAGGSTELLPETVGGGASFQVASTDGSIAFYTVGGALYRYEASTETAESIAGGVAGVLGATPAGSRVYYQDAAGLELWNGGAKTPVVPGAEASQASDYPPSTGTARVGKDGTLAFLSEAELTGHDNLDANTGEPDSELYVYRPAESRLICASCNPTGERPEGPATIPGAPANGSTRAYKPRALSDNGNRLIFDSADRLFSLDTNKQPDVYQWEASGEGSCARSPGCVSLLTDGRDPLGFRFVDASADGGNVFFLTNASLVGTDPGSIDLYDARAGGGFPEPPKEEICVGDACQHLPGEPEDPTPGTLVPNPGNPAPRYLKEKRKHRKSKRHRHRRRHHRHRHRGGHRKGRR